MNHDQRTGLSAIENPQVMTLLSSSYRNENFLLKRKLQLRDKLQVLLILCSKFVKYHKFYCDFLVYQRFTVQILLLSVEYMTLTKS